MPADHSRRPADPAPGPPPLDEKIVELELALGRARQAEQALRAERSRLEVTLGSIGDGVIVTDAAGRVTFLNEVAEGLTGWETADAAGRPLAEIFRIVNEQTRAAVENPAERALREGRVVGLANHTLLIARDGAERPIDDSAAPIRGPDGELIGVVLVFRDVTDRKRGEALRDVRLAIARTLAEALREDEAVPAILRHFGERLGWQAGVYWETDAARHALRPGHVWRSASTDAVRLLEATSSMTLAPGAGLPGRVWRDARPLWIEDLSRETNFPRLAAATSDGLRAAFAFPVLVDSEPTGVVEFFSRERRRPDDDLLEMAAAVGGQVGQFLERVRAEARLREETEAVETLHRVGAAIAAELDLERVVQLVTDETVRLTGAAFGAFFYNRIDDRGEAYTLYTLSGAPREAFERFPMPRNTDIFAPTFRGEGVLRLDDVTADPRYGRNEPYHGMPQGHLPVRSYLAVPVVSRTGEVIGGLFFGHPEPARFAPRHERLAVGLAAHAAVAIDNARLYESAVRERAAAEASRERLRAVVETAVDGIITIDERGTVLSVNPAAVRLFGYEPGEIVGRNVSLLMPEPYRSEHDGYIANYLRTGRPKVIGHGREAIGRRKDGSEFPMELAVGEAHVGGQRIFTGLVRDVTERKRGEQALRYQYDLTRAITDNATTAIFMMDASSRCTFMNPAAEAMTGYRFEEVRGGILHDFIHHHHPDGRPYPMPECPIDRALPESFEVRDHEDTFIRKNGEFFPVVCNARVIYENGVGVGTVIEVRDVTAERAAAEALRAAEERFAFVRRTSGVGFWYCDLPFEVLEWDEQVKAHFHLPPDAVVTIDTFYARLHPDDREPTRRAIERSITERAPYDVDYRTVDPATGAVKWVRAIGRTFYNPDGSPARFDGVTLDVTDRKRAEEALRTSEARLRLTLDATRMGIWEWDIASGRVTWSPTLEKIYGLPPGGFAGTMAAYRDAIHPDDRERMLREAAETVRTGRDHHVEHRIVWPDGSVHWVEGRGKLFRDDAGRPVRMAGVCIDVDDRKRAEQNARFLAEASATIATLVDYESTLQKVAGLAIPAFADWCAVDLVGDDGRLRRVALRHADPAKVELASDLDRRYPPREDAPIGAYHVLRTGEAEYAPEITDDMLAAGAADAEHLRILRKLRLRAYICVPLAVRGKTIGVITFVAAESGRRYDERDLELARELARRAAVAVENARLYRELREADRRKDEFLAMLAHELRNPLAPIRNALALLASPELDAPSASEAREVMERQVEHLVRLVDDLLDVSRIMRGRVELRKEPVELRDVLRRAVETARPLIRAQRHEFSVELPDVPVWLDADPVRLAQVFANLLNNAAKYTEPGGKVGLRAEPRPGGVYVCVSDTGVGIEPELLPRVFDLFTQSERSIERSQGGLGIGLSLVKALVELHGGTVAAESKGTGRGSTFCVTLPTTPSPAKRHDEPVPPTADRPLRVLVVEDLVASARLMGMMLRRFWGHEVRLAHDGLAALDAALDFRPEVVLLDIGLPGMNGYEVAHRLRQRPELRDALLVALTGYGQERDRRLSAEAGFDEHLVKPASVDDLRRVFAHPRLARPG